MPQIPTKYFGSIDYREEDVIRFPRGLPAFEEEVRFQMIDRPDRTPLRFLQSVTQPSLCFVALPILTIDPDYQLAMTPEDIESLELAVDRQPLIGVQVECLAILVAPENGPPTANLLAPIVVNRSNRLAMQAIRADSTYSHQHALSVEGNVCS